MITELVALLGTELGTNASVNTDITLGTDLAPTIEGPGVVVYPGPAAYGARGLHGAARSVAETAQVVCTSNTSTGVSTLANAVAQAVDGARVGGTVLKVALITPAQEDRTDPTEYRWSSTVDVGHQTPRG